MFDIAIVAGAEGAWSPAAIVSESPKPFSSSTEGVWERLMAGELKVGGHTESDTDCRLHLAPVAWPHRQALPNGMQHVLERLLSGVAQKVVGYEVARSPSSICGLAATALRRLGLKCSLSRSPLALAVLSTRRVVTADWRLVTEDDETRFEVSLRHPHHLLPPRLSKAEHDVARLMLDGLSHEEIATSRRRSPRTVANQVHSIFEKLGVSNRLHLLSTLLGTNQCKCIDSVNRDDTPHDDVELATKCPARPSRSWS